MAKTAGAKTKVYSKYGREIYVCAKSGGFDPDGNLSLRRLLDNAKRDQVPAHVIERAIEKARGGGGEDYAVARFEGFGPGTASVSVVLILKNSALGARTVIMPSSLSISLISISAIINISSTASSSSPLNTNTA